MAQEEFAPTVDVLIAEDDALTRQSLRLLLERQGYTCAEAADGMEAVGLAQRRLPRCVLLDLALPRMDGFAVVRPPRPAPRTSGVPIHCLTGHADQAYREQAREAGCETFLTKPVDTEALLRVVQGRAQSGEDGPCRG